MTGYSVEWPIIHINRNIYIYIYSVSKYFFLTKKSLSKYYFLSKYFFAQKVLIDWQNCCDNFATKSPLYTCLLPLGEAEIREGANISNST